MNLLIKSIIKNEKRKKVAFLCPIPPPQKKNYHLIFPRVRDSKKYTSLVYFYKKGS